jgi:hypothetical protein
MILDWMAKWSLLAILLLAVAESIGARGGSERSLPRLKFESSGRAQSHASARHDPHGNIGKVGVFLQSGMVSRKVMAGQRTFWRRRR